MYKNWEKEEMPKTSKNATITSLLKGGKRSKRYLEQQNSSSNKPIEIMPQQ